MLRHYREDIAALPDLAWIGYLSTVGVYGDHKGAWVDEDNADATDRPSAACGACRQSRPGSASAARPDRRVEIFRLSGIYGPGRSVIDNLKAGTARRIVKPGQVFNRIHVDDIARVLAAAIDKDAGHRIYNVSDDEPAPPEDVVAYAAELLGLPVPPVVAFEAAGLSGMAASFWAESKRVRNARIREDLGVELLYPTYREGLRALAQPESFFAGRSAELPLFAANLNQIARANGFATAPIASARIAADRTTSRTDCAQRVTSRRRQCSVLRSCAARSF